MTAFKKLGRLGRVRDQVAAGLAGATVTASLIYWFEPRRGARRRALVRDKVAHLARGARTGLDKTGRDLAHRARGLAAETRAKVRSERVDDETLEERVRAALGRLSSHPSAIDVTSHEGTVRLDGPVLQQDWSRVVRGVRRVRGVEAVEDRLVAHREPGNVPGLQGGGNTHSSLLERNWAPAPRLLAGIVGAALTALARSRRGPLRAGLAVAGLGLIGRSAANRAVRHWVRRRDDRQSLDIVSGIEVDAPVEAVYGFWQAQENLPRFLAPIQAVRRLGDGRWRWTAQGPDGERFEWDAEITRMVPNELLTWRTADGAPLPHTVIVHFQPNEDGGTRVEIRLQYYRPRGAAARDFRKLLSADPRQQVEDDLVRFKSLMEARSGG